MRLALNAIWLSMLLVGCSTTDMPGRQVPAAVFDDAYFGADRATHDPAAVIAMSPQMRNYLRDVIVPRSPVTGRVQGLVDALNSTDHLKLVYDSSATRTASETFDARRGDCLSLLLMTAAFAREMGLEVRFQKILTRDVQVPEGDLIRVVGHVNIGLARHAPRDVQDWVMVDFIPPEDAGRLRFQPLTQQRIQAMYFNNKAVEALEAGQHGQAYWWLRASSASDPGFASAYITLGALWDRAGRTDLAKESLAYALALDPGNPSAVNNLAMATTERSSVPARPPDAVDVVATSAARRELVGLLKTGRYDEARRSIEEALKQADRPELRLLLAVAYSGLHQNASAIRELDAVRVDTRTAPATQSLLGAKLSALREELAIH
ncbi:MAG: hypothetical protein OEU93_02520 [Rubrivivax sp.]|nr:hypothetical protein [Rubrivivax sp.]MDH5339879.1 hypothetical protein [Rubrivivax sp.]